ncbi:hypothetical protein Dda_3155 [Drechslerella dactyloides]|uniref:Uncharacterized protein n=1 Tax=Drechslerella dactyloides TaxID=74499 RepID=A0AAD6J0U0_DREDA|nr:hypothetical protein Dda_3155 [Drechslerella dactyloides]
MRAAEFRGAQLPPEKVADAEWSDKLGVSPLPTVANPGSRKGYILAQEVTQEMLLQVTKVGVGAVRVFFSADSISDAGHVMVTETG